MRDWRARFNDEALPFFTVLLESYGRPWDNSSGVAALRAAQVRAAATLPGVHLSSALDIGDPTSPYGNVHPRNKRVVGERLAAAALAALFPSPPGSAATPPPPPRLRPPAVVSVSRLPDAPTGGTSGGLPVSYAVRFAPAAGDASGLPVRLRIRPVTPEEAAIVDEDAAAAAAAAAAAPAPGAAPYDRTTAGFEVVSADGRRLPATVTVSADAPDTLVVAAEGAGTVTYGRAGWVLPIVLDDAGGLPIEPF